MSNFLLWFLKVASVELSMCILTCSLDHITGPIYLYYTVLPIGGSIYPWN